MRILVVEDEKKISSFLERGLKEEKFAVDIADCCSEGLYRVLNYEYNLIIMDLMLPDGDGVDLCQEIRAHNINTPILMLTAKSTLKEKVLGLNSGADDYLTKPFAFEELLARIRSLLRRPYQHKNNLLQIADLELNQITHEVKRAGQPISLTSKEYSLLEYMMLHKGEVITRTMISEYVWNESFDSLTNIIDVYIKYLRNKVDSNHSQKLIHTIRGSGYCLRG